MALRSKNSNRKASSAVMSKEEFRKQYNENFPRYERLAINLQQALKAFLAENAIPYLDVLYRVKDVDSAYEKVSRKEFDTPFEQIEDWSGLRVICYYPSDVNKICEIIKQEFDIISQEDTAKRLALKEFGYRSTHFILKVKSSWMLPPNYRGLENFKAEVQVRTILMHAWAEVEHKLQYKSTEQVPEQFQRKLYLLSAKFEEADGQFEELRDGITKYRVELRENITEAQAFQNQDLNLDTLGAFLNAALPEREDDKAAVSDVFSELAENKVSMADIVSGFEIAKDYVNVVEKSWRESAIDKSQSLTQVGALRAILEITNAQYRKFRNTENDESDWGKGIKESRKLLKGQA